MTIIRANDDNQLSSNYRQLSANYRQIIVNFPSNYRQFVKLLSNYCQIIVKLLSLLTLLSNYYHYCVQMTIIRANDNNCAS